MSHKILYVLSGRSVYRVAPGRKIDAMADCWRSAGHSVDLLFGGDLWDPHKKANRRHLARLKSGSPAPVHARSGWLAPIKHSISEIRDVIHNRRFGRYLADAIEEQRPDLIWERSYRLQSAGIRMANALQIPHTLEWKDNLINYRVSALRRYALRSEAYKNSNCTAMVVESNVLKERLVSQGVASNKISVAHNAVEFEQFRQSNEARLSFRKSHGIADNELVIGYLGSYAWYHDPKTLIDAFAKLHSRGNVAARLFMIGNGLGKHETEMYARRCNLYSDSGLTFLPAVPASEVPTVLSGIDVAILPGSTDIICPIKVQEYMASSTATIAPDYACNREVVEHGTDGLLFTPGNAESLASAIESLAKRPDMGHAIAAKGAEKMKSQFSWEQTWGRAMDFAIDKSDATNRR